jgi:hypothetical protein
MAAAALPVVVVLRLVLERQLVWSVERLTSARWRRAAARLPSVAAHLLH